MRNMSEITQDRLSQIRDRQLSSASDFERAHSTVRHRLQAAMLQAKGSAGKSSSSTQSRSTPYGSAWLPGPLSYPWLLMLAGIPKIIDQLIRQV